MENEKLLTVSSSPHIHSGNNITTAMRDVALALMPATILSIVYFGFYAVAIVLTAVVTAVVSEYVCQRVRKTDITIDDWSAALTGLFVALLCPPTVPLWVVAIGSASAIVIGKQLFGGLGNNLFNPALIGRAVIGASWPVAMSGWVRPFDGVSSATPLALLTEYAGGGMFPTAASPMAGDWLSTLMANVPPLSALFLGNIAGSLGETSAAALLLGGIYLIYKNHIDWKIPVLYIGTVFVLMFIFNRGTDPLWHATYHVLAGGLMLGAFYMATDWVSSPITKHGRIIYALGLGLFTFLIRRGWGFPEGVLYSILIMNMITPMIDRYTKGRVFGAVKKNG